jgi:hypothetical protein
LRPADGADLVTLDLQIATAMQWTTTQVWDLFLRGFAWALIYA